MKQKKVEKTIEQLVSESGQNVESTYELWERFLPLCIKWANKLKEVEYSQEDLLQESYLILIKALKTYKADKDVRFEAYFKYMLYRWGRDYMRKKREVLVFDEAAYDFWSNGTDEKSDVETHILYQEQIHQLKRGLKTLDPEDATLILELYIKNKTIKDLTKDKHMSYKALTSRKYYILKKLKKFFEEKQTPLRIYKV